MMATETESGDSASRIPPHLKEEEQVLVLSVPPISVERALEMAALGYPDHDACGNNSYGYASLKNIIGNKYLSGNYNNNGMIQGKSLVVPSHELHYTNMEHLRALEEGGCLFSFVCNHELTPYEADMVNTVINLTAFDDETAENYVPHYEYKNNDDDSSEYTFLLARCAYLFVGMDVRQLLANPSLLATLEYQRACQPAGTTVWDDYDNMEPDNFRVTKPIIPYLYDFTIQFRVSGILSQEVLTKLGRHVGIRVDGGILLERTKRSKPPKEDATKKCKSVLLYTDLTKGVFLVTHLTVILQQGLPEIVEKAIDTFGKWGLGETCETAWRTRRYMKRVMPLAMQESGSGSLNSGGNIFMDAKSTVVVEKQVVPCEDDSEKEDKFYDADETTGSQADDSDAVVEGT